MSPQTGMTPLQIAIVDPSLFTPQYDGPLVAALSAHQHAVLIGRTERPDQVCAGVPVDPMFYRTSEALRRSRFGKLAPFLKPIEHVAGWIRVLRRLRRDRFDLLHVQWAVLPIVDAAAMGIARRRVPVVITVHNTTPLHGGGRLAQRLGTSLVLRRADAIVVHTEHSRATLIGSGVPEELLHVVPHGPLGVPAEPVTREVGARLRLLQFGKLRPYKGLDVTVAALGALDGDDRSRVELTVAGDPMMDVEPLRAAAEQLDPPVQVRWELGYVDDDRTAELLAGHDVMLLPYRDVDGSGVLALAQANGMVVLATRVGGFAELLNGQESARLFDVDDHVALASLITELLDPGRRAEALAAAGAVAGSMPSWAEAARRHLQVYEAATARRGATGGR